MRSQKFAVWSFCEENRRVAEGSLSTVRGWNGPNGRSAVWAAFARLRPTRESAELASVLIEETCLKQGIREGQLCLHADRGTSMRSKAVALLLAALGVIKAHSRPYTSNDNPYSESQFRTMKYRPRFPDKFDHLEQARAFGHHFFPWYNDEHHHSGIGMMTPASVHYGLVPAILKTRQAALDVAYAAHPERFVRRPPTPQPVPDTVWITSPLRSLTILTKFFQPVSHAD